MGFGPDTYAALAAKISAGRAGVDSASATENTKESPIAVKIRAMRLWMQYSITIASDGIKLDTTTLIPRAVRRYVVSSHSTKPSSSRPLTGTLLRILDRYNQGTSVSAVQLVIESKSRPDTATRSAVSLSSHGRSSIPERKLLPPFSLPSQSRRTSRSYLFGFGRLLISACRSTASSARCKSQQCSACLWSHAYDILSGAVESSRQVATVCHLAAVNVSMWSPSRRSRDSAYCPALPASPARAAGPRAQLPASADCARSSWRIACTWPFRHVGP
jgi:hypothetical protein